MRIGREITRRARVCRNRLTFKEIFVTTIVISCSFDPFFFGDRMFFVGHCPVTEIDFERGREQTYISEDEYV